MILSRLTKEELIEAIRGMTREELLLLVKTLKKKFSLPLEEEEKEEWVAIPPSLTVKLTGYKPEADKRAIVMLIRYYTSMGLVEAKRLLDSHDFPIVIATIYDLLPHQIPPVLKKFEDLGAIVDYDYDWGNYIE